MNSMYPKAGRVILHVDMNSFYASVEMAYDPTLKGKPIAIAGNPEERRGIIVTCSYEARRFGVKTTMSLWEAKKLCPQLIILRPNFERYRAASIGMFEVLNHYSDLVEPVSIDEGYMDITASDQFGTPIEVASIIQNRIKEQLDLPCSIGIAPNKFLAKMASDMKKPLGITILRKRDVPSKLWPLPVKEMHGVGQKTSEKLESMRIYTIGDLAKADTFMIKSSLGINGERLKDRANGIDSRPVDPEAAEEFKSIGNSTTLPRDMSKQKELFEVLNQLAFKVSTRLKRKKVYATGISVMIRYKNRHTITRSKKIGFAIQSVEEIYNQAQHLFMKHWSGDAVRLLGITGTDLVEKGQAVKQLDLFHYEEDAKKEPLYQTIESLRKKYGPSIVDQAASLESIQKKKANIGTSTSFNKDFLQRLKKEKE